MKVSISERLFEASLVLGIIFGLGLLALATFLSTDPAHRSIMIFCYTLSGAFIAYVPIGLVIWAIVRRGSQSQIELV